MTAQPAVGAIGVNDHGHGVPATVALEPAFHIEVAREGRVRGSGNSVEIGSADNARRLDALGAQSGQEAIEKARSFLRILILERELQDGFDRFEPLFVLAITRFGQHVQFGRDDAIFFFA